MSDDADPTPAPAPSPDSASGPGPALPGVEPPQEGPPTHLMHQITDEVSTRIYMLAVQQPNVTRAQLIAAGALPGTVDAAIELLIGQGLLVQVDESAWEAAPPDQALPALARAYDVRAGYLRSSTEALAHLYHATRRDRLEGSSGVRVLQTPDHLATAILTVLGTATVQIRSMHDASPGSDRLFQSAIETHAERLLSRSGTPLRRRAVFDSALLDLPHAGDVLQARSGAGEEQRVITGVPFTVIVADDTLAVVDLTAFDTSGAGSLLVTDRRLVLALQQLCRVCWSLGTPMSWTGQGEVDDDTAYILSMLAAGATDALMAAQSGISQRTIERRVKALMDRLGAATRFQAGVLAARRGWI